MPMLGHKKERERQRPSLSRLHDFVTVLRTLTPDRYRLLNRCVLRTQRIVCYGLLQGFVDLRLLCAFHLDQTNSTVRDAEDCVVNVDIRSWHFHLKFCHGRTTSRHDGGLDILQAHLGLTKGLALNRTLRYRPANLVMLFFSSHTDEVPVSPSHRKDQLHICLEKFAQPFQRGVQP